jgi:hypothetical protein
MKTLFLILLVICISCSSGRNNSDVITIDVESPSAMEIKNISDIATDVRYIPLETHPDALMRFVNYLKTGNDRFYISTVLEILCFDKNGKFLYKLNQQGRGPGEYVYLSDYDILPEKKEMTVITRGKLNFYNENDSGFMLVRQIDLKTNPGYIDYLDDKNLLLTFAVSNGENKFQNIVLSLDGDTLLKRPNFNTFTRTSKAVMGFSADGIILKHDKAMRFKNVLNDTVFTITNTYKFEPYIILNTGGNNITTDFLANVPMPDNSGSSPLAQFLMVTDLNEVDRFFIYRWNHQQSHYWSVYDKKQNLTFKFDTKEMLKDDISGGKNLDPKFVCNGIIYSWTDALTLKNHLNSDEFKKAEVLNPGRKKELEKLAETLKEDDNHILIEITPKN